MNVAVESIEYVVSKMGHPDIAIAASNVLIKNQNIAGYRSADIGRNCTIRGNIELGEEVDIQNGCSLRINVKIGKRTWIGSNTEMIGDVRVGRYSAIARRVTFQQLNHPTNKPSMNMKFYKNTLGKNINHTSKGPITVGNDVWIGADTTILSGVTIGDGAVVGAGSVVTKDVEPYAIVAGTPAKRVKWRFSEDVREELLRIAWWEWDDEKIMANGDFFDVEIENISDIARSMAE